MKATCWMGKKKVEVQSVPDPQILNQRDCIVKVSSTAICGSDLHLYNALIPFMEPGDILGHEFMGEVVEVGRGVNNLRVGDRVVVPFPIACGNCNACQMELYSCCENSNPNRAIPEKLMGHSPAGIFGYTHMLGGYAGGQAEYARVPFADVGPIKIPNGLTDEQVLFLSDIFPTGYMGADMAEIKQGDVVAVWGAGAVGQMAAQSARLKGAERVIVIDRFDYRLDMAAHHLGVETLNYEETDIDAELRERSDGRGPDVCIEAVGVEAHTPNPVVYRWEQIKQQTRILETDRPHSLRQAVLSCRKGGMVYVLGVFVGLIDKFPMGAFMNKGLTMRSAQQHGERYIPMLLDRMARGEFKTAHLMTHPMPLSEGPRGYDLFKNKTDGCVRAVFSPDGDGRVTTR